MMNQKRIIDINRVPQNPMIRSNMSYGSTTTAFSEANPSNLISNLSKSTTNIPSSSIGKPMFKRCMVQSLPDFKGYGFTLNSIMEPKYSIQTIDPNSPAYKANLRETDVIVQIDNKNIRHQNYETVVQFLNVFHKRGQMEILCIDLEGYKFYKNRNKRFSSNNLVTSENTEHFSTFLASTSNQLPADCVRASNSRLQLFQEDNHTKQANHTQNEDGYNYEDQKFNRQQEVMGHLVLAMNNPELIKEIQTYNLYKDQGFFGCGITLHCEDISISKPEHKLVFPLIEIKDNTPAAGAGMKNYQRVVAVNGNLVNKNFHNLKDVVRSIEDSYYSRNYTEISVIDSDLWELFMENPQLAAKLAYEDTHINNNVLEEESVVTRF